MMLRAEKQRKLRMDMTQGPLLPKIMRFILPLILTNMLQQFYHAADIMIVGLSPEADAVGAVGSTATFLGLIRNLFIGFSVGTNVVVARYIGKRDHEGAECAIHTSICMGLLFGVIGSLLGILLTRTVLVGMGYSGTLLTLAVRYSYIYLACMPFLSLTNFLSAILRAQGNTETTLRVLSYTGILNIGLNLFFVKVLGWSVEGVAVATAIANLTSAVLLWVYLMRGKEQYRLRMRALRFSRVQFGEVARVGFPAGIQSSLFSISNILIQSSILRVNNLVTPAGSEYAPVIRGNSATGSLESFIFEALGATTVASSTFIAQNAGAGNYRRARSAFGYICLISAIIGAVMSVLGMLLHRPLLALYGVGDSADLLGSLAFSAAWTRMLWKWPGFVIYALMNACAGTIRGLGKSTTAAAITFFGTCVFRVIWIYTVFSRFVHLESIHISYPASWLLTGLLFLPSLIKLFKEGIRGTEAEQEAK